MKRLLFGIFVLVLFTGAPVSAAIVPEPLTKASTEQLWDVKQEKSSVATREVFEEIEFSPRNPEGVNPWDALRNLGDEKTSRLNVVFLIDRSGSMDREGKYRAACNALVTFMNTLRTADKFAVVSFSDDAELIHPYSSATLNQRSMAATSLYNSGANGGTYLGKAMLQVTTLLPEATPNSFVVLLSDGDANDENQVNQAVALYKQRGIRVITVNFGTDAKTDYLLAISSTTEGFVFGSSVFDVDHVYSRAAATARGATDIAMFRNNIFEGDKPSEYPIAIPQNTKYVDFDIKWEGSRVDLVLESPSGDTIVPDELSGNGYVCMERTGNRLNVRLLNPEAGDWRGYLRGSHMPPGGERLNFSASVMTSGGRPSQPDRWPILL